MVKSKSGFVVIRLLIFSLIIVLNSCNGLGPRDTSHDTPIHIDALKELPGTWNATKHIYKILKEKDYKIDSIKLILNADSTFKLINTPDCINDGAGESKAHLLENTTGTWSLENTRNDWMLGMRFDQGKIFETRTLLNFEIRSIDSTLTISRFIGDADQGDLLMFKKKE